MLLKFKKITHGNIHTRYTTTITLLFFQELSSELIWIFPLELLVFFYLLNLACQLIFLIFDFFPQNFVLPDLLPVNLFFKFFSEFNVFVMFWSFLIFLLCYNFFPFLHLSSCRFWTSNKVFAPWVGPFFFLNECTSFTFSYYHF